MSTLLLLLYFTSVTSSAHQMLMVPMYVQLTSAESDAGCTRPPTLQQHRHHQQHWTNVIFIHHFTATLDQCYFYLLHSNTGPVLFSSTISQQHWTNISLTAMSQAQSNQHHTLTLAHITNNTPIQLIYVTMHSMNIDHN